MNKNGGRASLVVAAEAYRDAEGGVALTLSVEVPRYVTSAAGCFKYE